MKRREFLMGAAVSALGAGLPVQAAAAETNAKEIAYTRRVPVKIETDVMVCGGGPAGKVEHRGSKKTGGYYALSAPPAKEDAR